MEWLYGEIRRCSFEFDIKIESKAFEINGAGRRKDTQLLLKLFEAFEKSDRFAEQGKTACKTKAIHGGWEDEEICFQIIGKRERIEKCRNKLENKEKEINLAKASRGIINGSSQKTVKRSKRPGEEEANRFGEDAYKIKKHSKWHCSKTKCRN